MRYTIDKSRDLLSNNNMQFLKQYNHSLSLLLVRVVAGVAFIMHGYPKIVNPEMFSGFFSSIGLGGSNMVIFVGLVELVGGVLLIAGIYTMYAGVLLSIVMLVAIFKVHFANGYSMMNNGYEYQLLLLAVSLGVVFSGPGRYSLWGGKCGCPKGMCEHKDGSKTCSC